MRATVLILPVLPEAGVTVVACAGVRAKTTSSATTSDPLVVHAPDTGVATALRLTYELAIGIGATMATGVALLVLTAVEPA